MRNRLFWLLCLGLAVAVSQAWPSATAQDITGGGSLVRDITGGAALIFRAPQNPSVSSATGGGRVKPGKKPPVRQQDSLIARANAARSAPKPRYAEAEQQYQLAAQIADHLDARSRVARDQRRLGVDLASLVLDEHRRSDERRDHRQERDCQPARRGAHDEACNTHRGRLHPTRNNRKQRLSGRGNSVCPLVLPAPQGPLARSVASGEHPRVPSCTYDVRA